MSSKSDQHKRTVVGIGAQGNAEDWSSEFDLEGGKLLKSTSFLLKALHVTSDRDRDSNHELNFDDVAPQDTDIDFTDSDDDTLPATNNYNNVSKSTLDALSDSEEDWDDELGITDEVQESQESMLNGFRHVISDTLGLKNGGMLDEFTAPQQLDDTVKTTIPARCKVVSMLLTRPDDVNLLVYPKSIPLYSLKLDGDKKQLMAMQLDDWLKNIVHKHKEKIEHVIRHKDVEWLRGYQSKYRNFSRNLLNAWAEVLTILWRNNSLGVYDMLKSFLKVFRQFSKMDKHVVKDLSEMSESDYNMSFIQVTRLLHIAAMADVLESISGKYTDGAGKRNDHHFRMIITDNTSQATVKAGKHNASGHSSLFPEILKCATVLFPDKLELLAVLELQAASHHVAVMLDNRIESNYSPTPYELFKSHIFLYRSISSAAREKMTRMSALKAEKKVSRRDKDRYEEEMKNCDTATTAILCDLCLLLHGHESLNVHYNKHLAAAIDMIFVEKNNIDRSSDSSDEDNEEYFDVYTQTRSKTSSGRSIGRSNTSASRSRPTSPKTMSPRSYSYTKKYPSFHHTHTTAESIELDKRSVANNSKVSNLFSLSQASKSSSKQLSSRQLSQELFENDEIQLYEVFVNLRTHRYLVATLLSKKYKKVSRKSPLKPIVAYTLGLLQSLEEDSPESQERTESLWLECLVLLDKQSDSRVSEVAPPVVTLFAVGVIESFAELLIKTSKYKFGVSSFEAVTECLLLLNSKDVKRLYRRLTNISTEARDIKRSIYYHCVMLRIAIEEGKLNEFVYIADLVGKLFLEVGETQLAERCLRVVALLHQGYTIKSVHFEKINLDKLLLNCLPEGIELPYIDLDTDTTVPVASVPGALLWARRAKDSVQCDSQQLHAIMKLVEAYVVSDYHQMALALCSCLLEKKVFPQGRIHVLLTMAKCFLKLRELKKCEATLDRIAYEADEIVSPLLNTGDEPSPPSTMDKSGVIRGSFIYGHGHDYSMSGYEGSRRDLSKLSRMGSLNEKRRSKNITRSGSINFFNDSHTTGASHHHTSTALLGVVTKVRSYEYIILRARCRLAADDPEWAILWLQIAFAMCPRGKFDRHGRIRYLTGRAYMLLCLRCHMGGGAVPPELAAQEAQYAMKAEEEFRAASSSYKLIGDIVKETKTLSRITELQLSRVFTEVAVEQTATLHEALHGNAEGILRSLESMSRLAMQLAGDTSAPLELIRTLVNTSELSWLLGNVQLSFSAWYEAKTLLTITFLQCLSVETPPPPNVNLQRQASSCHSSKIKKTFSFNSINSLNTSTAGPSNVSFTPGDFIPDPLNPLADAPLPVVKFAPGMLLRIYALLSRLVRLAFVIDPCPLSHYGGNLLTSWIRLNNVVSTMGTPLFDDIHMSLKKTVSSFHDICSCYHHPSSKLDFKNIYSLSNEMLDVLSYLSPDKSERQVLLEKLAKNGPVPESKVQEASTSEKEKKKSKRSSGDKLFDKELLVSSLNILQPFELMLRACTVDGVEGAEMDGALATDIVLNYLKQSVLTSLTEPSGEKAQHIVKRGQGPGITMTAVGHFVEGAMSYQAAETFVKKHEQHFAETSKRRDLSVLLKRNNDVYSPSDGYLLPETNTAEHTGTDGVKDKHNNKDDGEKVEDTIALLLGSHPKKSRIQILFLRLKSFAEQYAMGHLSLTEYYRNNMETLRSIVNAQSVVEDFYGSLFDKDERADRVRMSRSFSALHTPTTIGSAAPAAPVVNKRALVRSQTKEVMDQLEGGQDDTAVDELKNCFAPSFRFVIQLEPNSLLIYVPRTNCTATAVFRGTGEDITTLENSVVSYSRDLKSFYPMRDMAWGGKGTEVAYSNTNWDTRDDESPSPQNECGTLENVYSSSPPRGVGSPIVNGAPGSSMPDVSGAVVLDLPTTKSPTKSSSNLVVNPMMLQERGTPSPSNNSVLSNIVNKSNTMVSALTMPSVGDHLDNTFQFGKVNPSLCLLLRGLLDNQQSVTSAICPHYSWGDASVLSALSSLPLPSEDLAEVKKESIKFEDKMKEAGRKTRVHEEEKYSVNIALCSLGLQKLLFLLNCLMLEEPVLLLIAPGSEQLLVHVATALLRLLRPLQWQHLYIPLMHSTMYPQFRTLIEHHEPFFVGSYHQVLGAEVEAHRAISSKPSFDKDVDPFCLPRLSHVSIVDVNSGRVKPSSSMVYAHMCTVFDPHAYGISVTDSSAPLFFPEAANNPYFKPDQLPIWAIQREQQLCEQENDLDKYSMATPYRKHHSIEKVSTKHPSERNLFDIYARRGAQSASFMSMDSSISEPSAANIIKRVHMKTPIPARYRAHVYERLYAVLSSVDLPHSVTDLLNKPFEKPGRESPINEGLQAECSAVLLEAMFSVMISMFKGLKCFLHPASSLIPGGPSTFTDVDEHESNGMRSSFIVRRAKRVASLTRQTQAHQLTYAQRMFALSDDPGGYSCLSCQPLELVSGDINLKMSRNCKLSKLLDTGVLTQAKRTDGLSLPHVDEKQWIAFLRDDCQAFAKHLLHTTSFKLFCRDIVLCQRNHRKHQRYTRFHVSEFFYAFMLRSHRKLLHKMTIYRSMSTHRVAGYMITYFGRVDAQLEAQFGDEDDNDYDDEFRADLFDLGDGSSCNIDALRSVPFLHTFPFTPPLVKASLKTIMNSKKEPPLKIKRRWCVLDSQRFTYFKSRSSTDAKNYISMDPGEVRLVMAPFNHHPQSLHFGATAAESPLSGEPTSKVTPNSNNMTSLSDAFALVCNSSVIVLRAENLADHENWLLAFRSRLLASEAVYSNLEQHDSYKDTTGLLSDDNGVPKIALSNTLKQKYNIGSSQSSGPSNAPADRVFKYKNPEPVRASRGQDEAKHRHPLSRSLSANGGRPSTSTNSSTRSVSKGNERNPHHERPGRGLVPTTKNTRENGGRISGRDSDRNRDRGNKRLNQVKQGGKLKPGVGEAKYRSTAARRENGTRYSDV